MSEEKKNDEPKTEEKKREEYSVSGEELLAKVKAIIKAGNVRKIIVKDKSGRDIIVIPLTAGVVLTVLAPVLAAVGSIAALVTECTVVVERYSDSEEG